MEAEDHAPFAARLKQLAEERGSVRALASLAGISGTTVYSWIEDAEPSREKLVRIAEATDVSVAWLVAGEGEQRPHHPPKGYRAPSADPPLVPPPLAFSDELWRHLVENSPSGEESCFT